MLSKDLAALAAHFGKYRETGLELEPMGVVLMMARIQDMADDAAILEQNTRPILPMGGTGPLPIPEGDNLVFLERYR